MGRHGRDAQHPYRLLGFQTRSADSGASQPGAQEGRFRHGSLRGIRFGVVIDCEHGYVAGGWAYDLQGRKSNSFIWMKGPDIRRILFRRFAGRKTSDLNSDVLEGHRSTALCHLANISHRAGAMVSGRKSARPFRAMRFCRRLSSVSSNTWRPMRSICRRLARRWERCSGIIRRKDASRDCNPPRRKSPMRC